MKFFSHAVAIAVVCLMLTGCGAASSADPDWSSTSQPTGTQCYSELSPAEATQLAQYAQNNGDSTKATDDDTVCVVDGNGGMNYYHRSDSQFMNYWLLSIAFGRSANPLLMYGVIEGDISPWQGLMLSHMYGVGATGSVFRPYTYTSGSWYRSSSPTPLTVTNVYANGKTVSYGQFASGQRPAGWRGTTATVPAANNNVAKVTKSGSYSTDSSVSASGMAKQNKVTATSRTTTGASGGGSSTKTSKATTKPATSTNAGSKTTTSKRK